MTILPANLIGRGPHRPDTAPAVTLAGDLRLSLGRVHEICGLSRRVLALALAARLTGPVLWIAPAHEAARPEPCGFSPWLDPGRVVYVAADQPRDILWTVEEALRTGAVPVVIADLPAPPTLTQIRRMHLAAESAQGALPLGLLLTPEGGAAGVESRWRLTPAFDDGPAWRIERLRARTAPPMARHIRAASLLGRAPLGG